MIRSVTQRCKRAPAAEHWVVRSTPVARTGESPPSLNYSDESIQTGPTSVRFLITGANSGGSIAVIEFMIPAGVRQALSKL